MSVAVSVLHLKIDNKHNLRMKYQLNVHHKRPVELKQYNLVSEFGNALDYSPQCTMQLHRIYSVTVQYIPIHKCRYNISRCEVMEQGGLTY